MEFIVPIVEAKKAFPQFNFVAALTPSAQKAAFHVRDATGRDLCLKMISPEYETARLAREIRALQTLNHKNVARLEEYTLSSRPTQTLHYLIEEFIDGCDLSERLVHGKPWSVKSACEFFAMIADGLTALESHHVVHRDLKPQNVRIRSSGEPVIIDFGLARFLELPDLTRTDQGAAFGTPIYFAPEQFDGTKHDIDHRTDLFAIGVMFYQAVVGSHPFYAAGVTYQELRKRVCEQDGHFHKPEFERLPDKVKLIVRRILARDRVSRLGSASQVASVLRKLGGSP